uniref:Ras-GEF domain-containing protein n=1 Tax=Ditylenchus dipsaci TaxID=166011 RepID=A0A915DR90_9BILA
MALHRQDHQCLLVTTKAKQSSSYSRSALIEIRSRLLFLNLNLAISSTHRTYQLVEVFPKAIAHLFLSGAGGVQVNNSRKSSDGESSLCGWSSRASSAMSQRSSSGGLRLSTFSNGTSIASDNSGPFCLALCFENGIIMILNQFKGFYNRTRIPLPKRAISRSSGDSLRVPDRESPLQLLCGIEMSPDFQCIRQLLLNLFCMYTNKNANFVTTIRHCSDVLRQILNSPQHPQVKNWCADILNVCNSQLETEEDCKLESDERTNDEYLDLQDQIISGSLPCPKEEAALMAAVQLCVEENWPSNKRTQTIRRHLLKGQFGRIRDLANKIMKNFCWRTKRTIGLSKEAFLDIFACMSEPDPMMSLEVQQHVLPVDLLDRCFRNANEKLFHSHIYESELGMKKLYIQTAKKLPAYGCKVFQVKELLHGRTLRKTVRLLCLSSSVLCLLDGSSKMVLKRQHAATLNQWRIGGGVSKHQLLLEFRGAKWQLIAPSYNVLKSISMSLWEIMQNRASILVQKTFNKSARPSLALFEAQNRSGQSSRTNSYSSATSSFRSSLNCSGEPITLFRLELERLQYILHFPEEVAFQLSATEYQLFYSISPIDFIRYVGSDLASIPSTENPSPVRNLVKRLSEVSSWITHVIISQPTHDDRKNCLSSIIRVIDICGRSAISTQLPFWLSLKLEERQRYEEFVDILLPNSETSPPHPMYIEAVQKALRMPQCRIVPYFGTFLRDLYALVNDMPNVVIIGNDGETEKLKFLQDVNGDDHYSSNIAVGGLLNTDKINLVAIILDNLETFHKHNRQLTRYVETPIEATGAPTSVSEPPEVKNYEPVQPIAHSAPGVTLIPLNSATFDLDMIQKIQHGTTVIHYDPDSGRSCLCRLVLDASCSLVSWHRIYYGGKEGREKDATTAAKSTVNLQNIQMSETVKYPQTSAWPSRPPGSASTLSLDEGFIRTTFIKAIEGVDSYDLDIEAIYRRHSAEEMSVPVICWTINFGCIINDNEFLYFLAPQQIAQYWMTGLQKVVKCIQEQTRNPDRRVMWLKKLYLQLYSEYALNAFGGRVEKWRSLGMNQATQSNPRPTDSSSSTEGAAAKSRLKIAKYYDQMTIAVTRRVKGASRDCSRSQSPQPQSPLVRPPSIRSQLSSQSGPPGPHSPGFLLKPRGGEAALSDAGDLDSLYTPRSRTPTSSSYGGRSVGGRSVKSWRSRGGETPNSGSISSSGQISGLHGFLGKNIRKNLSTRMRKDLKDLFNDCVIHSNASANSHVPKRCDKTSPRLQSRLGSLTGTVTSVSDFVPEDILTRNTAFHLCHLSEKQHKIYNALALASVSSTG